MYKQRNSYDKNRSANSYTVVCLNYVFFVVRGLHVGQGRHGGHGDHVKDLAYIMLKLSKIRIWYYLVSLNREIRTIKIARRIPMYCSMY